jgi:hypothetical protein
LVAIPGLTGLESLAIARATPVVRLESAHSGGFCGTGHIILGAADVPFRLAIAIGHGSSQLGSDHRHQSPYQPRLNHAHPPRPVHRTPVARRVFLEIDWRQ